MSFMFALCLWTPVEVSVHSGALAQISANHICFVAWARAVHAATLLKDQCVVGISCEVADCGQISTPGLTFTVQAYIMSNRRVPIIRHRCSVCFVLMSDHVCSYEDNEIQVISTSTSKYSFSSCIPFSTWLPPSALLFKETMGNREF